MIRQNDDDSKSRSEGLKRLREEEKLTPELFDFCEVGGGVSGREEAIDHG